jgi:hypothetical protein
MSVENSKAFKVLLNGVFAAIAAISIRRIYGKQRTHKF